VEGTLTNNVCTSESDSPNAMFFGTLVVKLNIYKIFMENRLALPTDRQTNTFLQYKNAVSS